MNRWGLLLAAISALAASCAAGYFAVSSGPMPEGLHPDPRTVNFGEVGQGETLTTAIRFTNHHKSAISVIDLSRECSCSNTRVDQMSAEPGRDITLHVEWRVGTRRGPLEESVGILYRMGDKLVDLSSVQLRAVAVPDYDFEPKRITFERGRAETVTVRFTPGRRSPVKVDDAVTNFGGFIGTVSPDRTAAVVQYDPSVPEHGELGYRVTVGTDSPNQPRVEIPITFVAGSGQEALPAAMPGSSENRSP